MSGPGRTPRVAGLLGAAAGLAALSANAAPVTYQLDPNHTYPSFEADHFGGLSVWRGKFDSSSGRVVLDREGHTGTVQVVIDAASIDFGNHALNEHAKAADMFDVAHFPTATYTGRLAFRGDVPTAVQGSLTLHGVTRPLDLAIRQFKCIVNPLIKKQVCGADAEGTFNRAQFGVNAGQAFGFDMTVRLRIQVEGVRVD